MNEQYFLQQLKLILQCDEVIEVETMLHEIEEWDSLAFVQIISFFDKHFEKRITFNDLTKCFSPSDIILLANGAIKK